MRTRPRSRDRKRLADEKRSYGPEDDDQHTGDASDGCGDPVGGDEEDDQ